VGTRYKIRSSRYRGLSSMHVAAFGASLSAFIALHGCGSPPADNHVLGDDGGGAGGNPPGSGTSSGGPGTGGATPGANSDGGGLGRKLDGAASDGMVQERCTIVGSTRSCCGGNQQCMGNEFPVWGPCLDSKGAPAFCNAGCGGSERACDAGVDSPPPPVAICSQGMACKPGAIRYCDFPGHEWTKSTCDPTGNWGPCLATIAPVGMGCSQTSFTPEICCPPLHLCCQNDPGGPWMDWSSGGCAAISCP
jgi:hypothetical protein